jgi:hypothetical protein
MRRLAELLLAAAVVLTGALFLVTEIEQVFLLGVEVGLEVSVEEVTAARAFLDAMRESGIVCVPIEDDDGNVRCELYELESNLERLNLAMRELDQ